MIFYSLESEKKQESENIKKAENSQNTINMFLDDEEETN